MKIIVTGSSGFIGFHLSKRLLDIGHSVVGIDSHTDYYDVGLKEYRCNILKGYKKFKFHNLNISNLSEINGEYDIAINLAAQPGVRVKKEKTILYEKTNIRGFEVFCNFCEENNIRKIIYASSSSVYSDKINSKYHESELNLNPKSEYGISKLKNEEHMAKIYLKSNIEAIGLRFFSVYGPYGRPDMAYYAFTNAIEKGIELDLNNKGKMFRDMTYIEDIIDGIIQAVEYLYNNANVPVHEIFNLGNDSPIQTLDVLGYIEEYFNKKAKINFVTTTNEATKTHADISKAKNLLGYNPKTNFKNGIKKFLNWYVSYENK